jgi:hypothetical protein
MSPLRAGFLGLEKMIVQRGAEHGPGEKDQTDGKTTKGLGAETLFVIQLPSCINL